MVVFEEPQEPLSDMLKDYDQEEVGLPLMSDEEDEDLEDIADWFAYLESYELSSDEDEEMDDDAIASKKALLADDALSLYLNDMGQVPLLSQEDEVVLARKMERGREAQEELTQSQPTLSSDRIAELKHLVEEGEQARDHFIKANTRLVVSQAKRYRGCGLAFLDLIQAGNVGLIKAVDRFDYRMGNKFSTYAVWWIRQAIRRSLTQQGYTIRLPAHLRQRLRKYHKTVASLEKKMGRRPTLKEIAEALGVKQVRRIQRVLQVGQRTLSLNALVGEEEDSELLEFIESDDNPPMLQQVQRHFLKEDIQEVMNEVLTPREVEVLRKRYGLEDLAPKTLQALSDDLGVSRERVRQIERRAFRKLRNPRYGRKLRSYLS